ncbi:MAG: DUF892 family protein [Chloroflexota bacterium]|jgi:ferritin-like metal-binding protein YciE
MAIQNAEELFIIVLSNVHAREKKAKQLWQDMSKMAQDDDVKQVLSTRAHLTQQSIDNLEECFRILGKQPVQTDTKMHDILVDDFQRELNAIQQPGLKTLYIIHKAREIALIHAAAYTGLISMAELMDNIPISALLETNLASKMVFAERVRELVREIGMAMVGAKMRKAA